MNFEQKKNELVKQAQVILDETEKSDSALKILREYNRWYTITVDFVKFNTQARFTEFETKHKENQSILSSKTSDLYNFKVNLTIQIAIIEGSSERTFT